MSQCNLKSEFPQLKLIMPRQNVNVDNKLKIIESELTQHNIHRNFFSGNESEHNLKSKTLS